RPILAHIIDDLVALGIRKLVLVVGYLGESVTAFARARYPQLEIATVEQRERLGLGHAVSLAGPQAGDGPIPIVLGDTLFEADLKSVLAGPGHAIGVKAVEDPRRFGVVEVDREGRVTRMVEKPEHPASNLAITGVYYFARGAPLFRALEELRQKNVRTRGEF